jgi:signal peptidase I
MKIQTLSVSIIFLIISCSSNIRKMDTSSMAPSIVQGEEISIEPAGILKKQDIIAFNYNDPSLGNKTWVFRIIGIPGDTIQIKQGSLYVNGNLSKEPFVQAFDNITDAGVFQPEILGSTKVNGWNIDNYGPIIIPMKGEIIKSDLMVNQKLYTNFLDKNGKIKDDLYFVLGDSRHDAYDSRFIGFIPKSEIVGLVKKK